MNDQETEFGEVLSQLAQSNVRFILIGGLAAMANGSARSTLDLVIVYQRTDENIRQLVSAVEPHQPYLRGAPSGLPFAWDAHPIRRGFNFTLTTNPGDLDFLGEVVGGGDYE